MVCCHGATGYVALRLGLGQESNWFDRISLQILTRIPDCLHTDCVVFSECLEAL